MQTPVFHKWDHYFKLLSPDDHNFTNVKYIDYPTYVHLSRPIGKKHA